MSRPRKNPFAGASSIVGSGTLASPAQPVADGREPVGRGGARGRAGCGPSSDRVGRSVSSKPRKTSVTLRLSEDLADLVRSAALMDGPSRGSFGLSGWVEAVLREEIPRVEEKHGIKLEGTPTGVIPGGWISHQ